MDISDDVLRSYATKYTASEIASILNISRQRVYETLKRKNLKAKKGKCGPKQHKNVVDFIKSKSSEGIYLTAHEIANELQTTIDNVYTLAKRHKLKLAPAKQSNGAVMNISDDILRSYAAEHTVSEISDILNIPTRRVYETLKRKNLKAKKGKPGPKHHKVVDFIKSKLSEGICLTASEIASELNTTTNNVYALARNHNLKLASPRLTDEVIKANLNACLNKDSKKLFIIELTKKYNITQRQAAFRVNSLMKKCK